MQKRVHSSYKVLLYLVWFHQMNRVCLRISLSPAPHPPWRFWVIHWQRQWQGPAVWDWHMKTRAPIRTDPREKCHSSSP